MTDIVERLRANYNPTALWLEAANTIEWLRADLLMWRRRSDMWHDENAKKQVACEQMGARIVELEAQLAEARKDLKGALILAEMARDSSLAHQERAERRRQALQDIADSTARWFARESDLIDYRIWRARAALAKEFDNE